MAAKLLYKMCGGHVGFIMRFIYVMIVITFTHVGSFAAMSCLDLFANNPNSYRGSDARKQFLAQSHRVKRLIQVGTGYHSGRVSTAYATEVLNKIQKNVIEVRLLPELDIPKFQSFKVKLEKKIDSFQEKIKTSEKDVDFFELLEISIRSSLLFNLGDKAFQSQRTGASTSPHVLGQERYEYISLNLQLNSSRDKYADRDINQKVTTLKETLAAQPELKIILTFESLNEIDIYHLLRKRIFIFGLSEVTLEVDRTRYVPSNFLEHDMTHLYAFFGFNGRNAAFNRIDQQSDSNIAAAENRWKKLESQLSLFEARSIQMLESGHVKYAVSVSIFLFELYHESFESIYASLTREIKFTGEESLERISDLDRTITHDKNGEVQSDLRKLLVEARKVFTN